MTDVTGNDPAMMHSSMDKPDSSSLNALDIQHFQMIIDRLVFVVISSK
jgi:hypothetical protein